MDPIQIPSRDVIVSLCQDVQFETHSFAYNDHIWIKCGPGVTLGEAAIQRYVHRHADPNIVRIPEVYDAFTRPQPKAAALTYIVMENVKGDNYATFSEEHPEEAEQVLEAIANAVRHIWDIPLPPNASPGPFERQVPVDRLFSDCGPTSAFNNVTEMEDWLNNRLKQAGRPDRISLQGEPLSLCHCDLGPFNIRVGEPVAILDWGCSGIYPHTFEEFAIVHQFNLRGAKFAKALHRQLFGPKFSKSVRALCLASRYNWFGC